MSVKNVLIVGGGIAGCSTAYHLAKELSARSMGSGADVLVLDQLLGAVDRTGSGAGGPRTPPGAQSSNKE